MKILFYILISLLIASCSIPKKFLYSPDLQSLEPGLSINTATTRLGIIPKYLKKSSFGTETVLEYTLFTGVNYSSSYLLYFQEDSLLFWGFPHDFAKADDTQLNLIHKKLFIQNNNK